MRVISGSARGRRLKEPSGYHIRPTNAKVKESVFNIIQFDIEGRRVLDLFAGTGQLGIEAISRGARSAVFVDSDKNAVILIRENLKLCGFTDKATIMCRDVLRYLEGAERYDVIFIDAPYSTLLATETIQKIIKFDKLETNGIIMCETGADYDMPVVEPPYFRHKEYRYGAVKITRYERS